MAGPPQKVQRLAFIVCYFVDNMKKNHFKQVEFFSINFVQRIVSKALFRRTVLGGSAGREDSGVLTKSLW